ncbi:MAG: XRE family transcriptional regulator [Chloroflexota bacterium]
MNLVRLGLTVRQLRRHLHWRQTDLARRASISQQAVSRLERGHAGRMSLDRIQRVLHALGADAEMVVRWRGGSLDRLLDERHATMLGQMAARLATDGWETLPEVSYSEFGERGSIDVLAWRLAERVLLIVEIKTELVSIEATLRKHDEKSRLAPTIATARIGHKAWRVGRLLVLPDTGATRRRIKNHALVLDRAYPLRGQAARDWLRGTRPDAAVSSTASISSGALILLPLTPGAGGGRGRVSPHRVRRPAACSSRDRSRRQARRET